MLNIGFDPDSMQWSNKHGREMEFNAVIHFLKVWETRGQRAVFTQL